MIDPKLHLLNSFLAFLQCVSMRALYTPPGGISHNCFHSCNPWPACMHQLQLTCWVQNLTYCQLVVKETPAWARMCILLIVAVDTTLALVYMHRTMLPQWPTFPHVPTYQITLPTYVHSCVAECKETEDSQLRVAKIHWQRTSDVPTGHVTLPSQLCSCVHRNAIAILAMNVGIGYVLGIWRLFCPLSPIVTVQPITAPQWSPGTVGGMAHAHLLSKTIFVAAMH